MFNTQPNNPQNQPKPEAKSDSNISNIEIHTLKKDLESLTDKKIQTKDKPKKDNIKESASKRTFFFETDNNKDAILPEIKNDSPFLKEEKAPQASRPNSAPTPPANLPTQEKKPSEPKINSPLSLSDKKISVRSPFATDQKPTPQKPIWPTILWGLTVFLIIFSASLGFYLLYQKKYQEEPTLTENNPPVSNNEEPNLNQPPPTDPYLLDKPNYLHLDTNLSSLDIQNMLQEKKASIASLNNDGLYEFILTDQSNNPLSFQNFAQKLELNLPAELYAQMDTNFSLFIQDDQDKATLGFVINVLDENQVKEIITKNEKNLASDLDKLFFSAPYNKEKSFNSSLYKGVPIRFQNIVSPDILSIDYAVYNKSIYVGTTKKTIRAILDRLNPNLSGETKEPKETEFISPK